MNAGTRYAIWRYKRESFPREPADVRGRRGRETAYSGENPCVRHFVVRTIFWHPEGSYPFADTQPLCVCLSCPVLCLRVCVCASDPFNGGIIVFHVYTSELFVQMREGGRGKTGRKGIHRRAAVSRRRRKGIFLHLPFPSSLPFSLSVAPSFRLQRVWRNQG